MPAAAPGRRRAARGPLAAYARLTAALVAVLVVACGSPAPGVETADARAHIQALAGTIGTRPHGSAAATRAREYIASELRQIGFTVRIQEADAVDARRGLTARVRNVIAWLDGSEPAAVALVSHYDSRPGAPGAIDDGLGVAVSLASARILAAEPRRHSLAILVTDAEELGLMGARALVADPEVARRVGAVINLEGNGGSGPMYLFEATGGAVLRAWAGSAAPEGSSLGNEIYRRMPNDTDFTILRGLGVDGINLAPIGDAYAYHTTLDLPDRVSDSTIAHGIATVTSTVRALDDVALPADVGDPDTTFVDLAGRIGVVYAPWMGWVLTVLAVGLGVVAWVFLALEGRRKVGATGLAITAAVAVVVVAAAAAGLAGAAWVLPAVRAEVMPWYAAPWFYYVFIATGGVAGGWAVARLARRLAPRRVWRSATAIWWLALPVLALLAVFVQRQAPPVSFMFTGPLLTAAVAGVLVRRSAWLVRVATVLPALAIWLLWAGDSVRLLSFLAALAGWLPAPPPWWAFAAVVGLCGGMLTLPLLAFYSGLPALPRAAWGAVATVAPLIVAGSAALALPAYRDQRPARRAIAYVEHVGTGAAWIAGGRESSPDLSVGPEGQPWQPLAGADVGERAALSGVAGQRYHATAAGGATVPAVVTASARIQSDGRRQIDVTVLPRQLVTAQLRLPPGVVPREASVAGRTTGDRWVATYAAVPSAGLTMRFALDPPADPAALLADLAGLDVVLTTALVPGASAAAPLPDWLPRAASTWTTRAVFVIPVTPSVAR